MLYDCVGPLLPSEFHDDLNGLNDWNDWNGPRLLDVLGETKADVVVPGVGGVPAPVR